MSSSCTIRLLSTTCGAHYALFHTTSVADACVAQREGRVASRRHERHGGRRTAHCRRVQTAHPAGGIATALARTNCLWSANAEATLDERPVSQTSRSEELQKEIAALEDAGQTKKAAKMRQQLLTVQGRLEKLGQVQPITHKLKHEKRCVPS